MMDIPTSPNPRLSRVSDQEVENEIIKHRAYLRDLNLKNPKELEKMLKDLVMEKLYRASKENQNLVEKPFGSRPVTRQLTCPNLPNSTGPFPLGIRNGKLAKKRGTTSRGGEAIIRARQGAGGGESSEKGMPVMSSQAEELEKVSEWEKQLKETDDLLQLSLAQQETMRKGMEDAARRTQALMQKREEIQSSIADCQKASQTRSKMEWERLLKEKEGLLEATLKAQEVMKKDMEDATRQTQALKRKLDEKDSKMECIVCFDEFGISKQRAHYQDCNHANICLACATTLWQQGNKRCPSCNTTSPVIPLRLPAKIFL